MYKSEIRVGGRNVASIDRRKFLKSTTVMGAIGSSSNLASATTRNGAEPSGDSPDVTKDQFGDPVQAQAPFFELSFAVPEPDDAMVVSPTRMQTAFRKVESKIYITKYYNHVFREGDGRAIVATPYGLRRKNPGDRYEPQLVPVTETTSGCARSLGASRMTSSISIRAIGETAEFEIDGEHLALAEGEQVGTTQKTQIEYQTRDGVRSLDTDLDVTIRNHGLVDIISHEELIVIPKESAEGRHAGDVIRPKLTEKKRVGMWESIVDLESVNAWGIVTTSPGGDGR